MRDKLIVKRSKETCNWPDYWPDLRMVTRFHTVISCGKDSRRSCPICVLKNWSRSIRKMLTSTHVNTKGHGKLARTNKSIDIKSEGGQEGADAISFTQKVEMWLEVGLILARFQLSVVSTF